MSLHPDSKENIFLRTEIFIASIVNDFGPTAILEIKYLIESKVRILEIELMEELESLRASALDYD